MENINRLLSKRKYSGPTPQHRTHPLIWLVAIIITLLVIAVIIGGLVILIGYMIIQPKVPDIKVTYSRLDMLNYDRYGVFSTQITLYVTAINENAKARATFSDISFVLRFDGVPVAELRAEPFEIPRNSTKTLPYVVQSSSIPLEGNAAEEIDASLKRDKITFHLKGGSRVTWNIGPVGPFKFRTHLFCKLDFFPTNGSSVNSHSHCSPESD